MCEKDAEIGGYKIPANVPIMVQYFSITRFVFILDVCLTLCLTLCLSLCQFTWLYLSVCLSVCMSLSLFLSLSLSLYPSLSVCLLVCRFIVCLFYFVLLFFFLQFLTYVQSCNCFLLTQISNLLQTVLLLLPLLLTRIGHHLNFRNFRSFYTGLFGS